MCHFLSVSSRQGDVCYVTRNQETWQEEEWTTIITSPVSILSLQLGIKGYSVQGPLMGCLSFR